MEQRKEGLIQVSLVIGRSDIIDQRPLIDRVRNLNISNSCYGLFRVYDILVTDGSKTILHYMTIDDEAANLEVDLSHVFSSF